MPLFQSSVLKKYIQLQEKERVQKAYKKYTKYFHNATIQENIRSSKEEEYQGIFLTELFVNVLGYTLKPNADFNLVAEYKNQTNARKADGAILKDNLAVGVIELKGTNTKDLESIRKQAFDYKANQKGCVYVITSNFEKLRFYINDATEFEEFNLFELTQERFELFYLCLQKDNILNNIPLKIKEASIVEEEQITKHFYKDYSLFKRELYRDLVKRNSKRLKISQANTESLENLSEERQAELVRLEKTVKLTLFKKSQKLIDRFLFIFFAEDRGLLPPNSTLQILNKWKADNDFGDERPLYDLFKQYFKFLDKGRQGTSNRAEIYAYNGGLFKEDTLLDTIEIDNELLYKYTNQLAAYDFESQVGVNILGHIFENSLNEIESVNAEIEGGDFDKQKSKRKKDGVFYTPKYITKYIVENTIGKLCDEKKTELGFKEDEYFKGRKNRNKSTITKLVAILDDYRDWLLQLTICDPACGSGAFLNQALDFLIKEHTYIDELKIKVLGGGLPFSDIENTILENNIYGVDLNEESVEIAKLSLWLRTAQPRRKLNDLSSNIKCGNSLIDNKAVAGDKAFHWETEFSQIFAKGGFDVIIGNPPYVQIQSMGTIATHLKNQNFKTYERTGDLYCLFYELGNIILKEKGLLGFITSNKWLRANYGKSLRNYLLEKTQPKELLDLGSGIFESATVDSNILIFQKTKDNNKPFIGLDISKEKSFIDFTIFENIKVEINPKGNDIWTISNPIELQIKNKLEKVGTPLKKWNIKINYGIKTGFNEAFIIDGEKKNELTNKDSKNSEIIVPILRGRDIKRYVVEFADLFLINSHNGYKNIPRINIDDYPFIKEHFNVYYSQLEKRQDKGDTPYNLRSCTYIDEFEKEKLFYNEIGNSIGFYFSSKNYFCNNKLFFLTSDDINLLFLSSFFNSKLYQYYFSLIFNFGGGKGRELFGKVPIPKLTINQQQPFIAKANQILSLNKDLQETSSKFQRTIQRKFELEKLPKKLQEWYKLTYAEFVKELAKKKIKLSLSQEAEWEDYFITEQQKAVVLKTQIDQTDKEIDAMVYELYGLSEEEIAIVERS